MSSLTADQIALQLDGLEGWEVHGVCIQKTYQFIDFGNALAFMVESAFHAQELEHYPNWQNFYNNVRVCIGDDAQSGIHSRDIQLARRLETVYQRSFLY